MPKRIFMPLLAILIVIVQVMNPVTVFADDEIPAETIEETTAGETEPGEEDPSTDESGEGVTEPEPNEMTEEITAGGTKHSEENPTTDESQEGETEPETQLPPEPSDDDPETGQSDSSLVEEGSVPEEVDLSVAETLEQTPDGTEIVVVNGNGEVEPLATEQAAEIISQADPLWCPNTALAPTPGSNGCSPSFTTMTDLITWLTTNDPDAAGTIWIEDAYDSASEGVAGFTLDGSGYTKLDNNALTIQGGWNGISGSTAITGTSSFTGDYLHITNWNADVTLNDIIVDGAADTGVYVMTTGTVSLDNIQSNNNLYDGIEVETPDNIVTNDLTATQNGGWGARVYSNTPNHSVTMNGTNTFNGNSTGGLGASARSDLTLNSITANDNDGAGLAIQTFTPESVVHLTGVNVFNNNKVGWFTTSGDSTFVENITANDNDERGIYFFSWYDGNLNISNATMNGNGFHGLEAYSRGNIMLSDVTADGNGQHGVFLHDAFGNPTVSVTLTGTNSFSNNGYDGFRAITVSEAITLNNVTANDNGGYGVFLNNTASATDAGITISGTNVFNGNITYGLHITSDGVIHVNNITANENNLDGAYLDNTSGNTETGVNVTGSNFFNENSGVGLFIQSDGAINTANLTANQNLVGVALDNSTSTSNANVFLSGTNSFNANSIAGLGIISDGDVDVYRVTTNNNYSGVNIVTSGDVTITCSSINNETYGLNVDSNSLTLSGLTFSGNSTDISSTSTPVINIFECNPPTLTPTKTSDFLPIHEINTTGGASELDCDLYRGTKLILPNGDFAYFPCPIQDTASIYRLENNVLPADLPSGTSYLSGFTTEVITDGISDSLPGIIMTISFSIPDDANLSSLTILYWDGVAWVEQTGFVSEDGLSFHSFIDFTGSFVLVQK